MARYAVLRIAKVKTMSHVAGLGMHVERERETRNADEGRRQENERLAGTGDWCADVERRLAWIIHEHFCLISSAIFSCIFILLGR